MYISDFLLIAIFFSDFGCCKVSLGVFNGENKNRSGSISVQVVQEETFLMAKSDLRFRRVYYLKENRIKEYLLVCFAAFVHENVTWVLNVEYRKKRANRKNRVRICPKGHVVGRKMGGFFRFSFPRNVL